MKTLDVVKLAMQNLLRIKFRSFLTILGVIIGISAIVLFVSLGLGLQKITSDQIATLDILTTLTVNQTPETAALEAGPPLTQKSVEKFKNIKNVESVSPTVNMPSNVVSMETNSGAIVYGVEEGNFEVEAPNLIQGVYPANGGSEVIISMALANTFSQDISLLIGKDILIKIVKDVEGLDYKLDELNFKVVGIDNNDSTNIIYAPFGAVYDTGQFENYSSVKVKVKSRKDVDKAKEEIKNMYFQVTTIKDLIDQIDKVFLLFQIILGLIGGIGLLVSSLGIINTMTISLLERTHEIGIMKAIGASNRDLRRIFFAESALIGLFGGISGVAIAIFFEIIFNTIIKSLVEDSGQSFDLFITPVVFSLCMIAFAIFVSVVSGIYPAIRAQRLSAIDALRQN